MARAMTYDQLKEVLKDFAIIEVIEIWHEAKTGHFSDINTILADLEQQTKKGAI